MGLVTALAGLSESQLGADLPGGCLGAGRLLPLGPWSLQNTSYCVCVSRPCASGTADRLSVTLKVPVLHHEVLIWADGSGVCGGGGRPGFPTQRSVL